MAAHNLLAGYLMDAESDRADELIARTVSCAVAIATSADACHQSMATAK
jgi:hypothetical protein